MSTDAEQGLSETSQAKMTTASSVDVKDIFQDEFIEEPLKVNDGYAEAPELAGHGIVFDFEKLKKFKID